jgi:ABC-type enterobactin transport system permease subunit
VQGVFIKDIKAAPTLLLAIIDLFLLFTRLVARHSTPRFSSLLSFCVILWQTSLLLHFVLLMCRHPRLPTPFHLAAAVATAGAGVTAGADAAAAGSADGVGAGGNGGVLFDAFVWCCVQKFAIVTCALVGK